MADALFVAVVAVFFTALIADDENVELILPFQLAEVVAFALLLEEAAAAAVVAGHLRAYSRIKKLKHFNISFNFCGLYGYIIS